jgi:hypothetical protein
MAHGVLVLSRPGQLQAPIALIMSSVHIIGVIVPYFMPQTVGKPLPE